MWWKPFVLFGFLLVLLKEDLFYDGLFNSHQFKDKPLFNSSIGSFHQSASIKNRIIIIKLTDKKMKKNLKKRSNIYKGLIDKELCDNRPVAKGLKRSYSRKKV